MLDFKIKGGRVTHLTDARYFAAIGVEWLGIDLTDSEHPVQEFKEIADWVEVPHIVAEHRGFDLDQWREFVEFSEARWIQGPGVGQIEGVTLIREDSLMPEADFYLLEVRDVGHLQELGGHPDRSRFLVLLDDLTWKEEHGLLLSSFAGIEVRGSEEEKVGWKSYEDLDDFFDSISAW